jgi:drug/metabolite transporter (DMT)-like permease
VDRVSVSARSYLTLAVVCTGWGTIPLIVRSVALPAAAIVAMRLWIAAAALGAALWAGRRRFPGPRLYSILPWHCLAAAVILAFHWLALFAAYKRAPAGTVILLVYLAPVGIAAVAPRALGESLGSRTLGALGLATIGFLLVGVPAVRGAQASGVALGIVAAVLFVALVVVSKPLAEAYGGLRLAFLEMAGAGVVLIPVAARTAWGAPQITWLWLVLLGLVHTALGTGLYLGALARVPATHVGILGYLEPASVVVCGWLFLSQRPGLATVAGGALIAAAGALVVRTASVPEVPGVPG